MRPKGSADFISYRRRRAVALLKKGLSLNEVARTIGCFASSVLRWKRSYNKKGDKAFQVRFSPGRPPKLIQKQKKSLIRLLVAGPLASGYRTDLWTTKRIAEVIEKHYAVHYHRDHIGKLLKELGWSYQKPERRAIERDEQAIEIWKKRKWPNIKKKPEGWVPTSYL